MSKALLRKSLEFVDPECLKSGKQPAGKQKSGVAKRRGKRQPDIEAIRKQLKSNSGDRTEENLRRLKQLSSASQSDDSITQKILERAGKVTKKPPQRKKSQKSVFTEEDFAKFEREYFVSK